jgi:hypothetical protein
MGDFNLQCIARMSVITVTAEIPVRQSIVQ